MIERNLIANNAMVGLACMANGVTAENFAGAPMVEPVKAIGNTFSGNPYGVTGGDNMLLMNNIVVGSTQLGVKRVAASSLVTHTDLWNNATDDMGSNVDVGTTLHADPLLDSSDHLQPGSPCIDAGAATLVWNGNAVTAPPYTGPAPDLGAYESAGPASTGNPDDHAELALSGARPNPTTGGITVAFTLRDETPARIELMDVSGRL